MDQLKSFPVFGDEGQIGHVLARSRFLDDSPARTIRTMDGQEYQVPAEWLRIQDDGTFILLRPETVTRGRAETPPTVEAVEASFAAHAGGGAGHVFDSGGSGGPGAGLPGMEARSTGALDEVREARTEATFFESGYDVETVRVNQILDGPARERREGDVLILPVVEEVRVVEKKMLLRDEIRITPHKRPVTETRTISKV